MSNISTFKKHTLLAALFSLFAVSTFAHFGPRSPLGGTVNVAIEHNGTVYLGTEQGGVYESTNALLTIWRPRPVGLLSGKISALAHSGSYLFAGTADSGVFIFDGFVGTDRYWRKVNGGLSNLQIGALVTLDSISVLAGTTGGGLFKTTDKGASWNAVNDPLVTNETITALVKSNSRVFLTTMSGGVFASDDNGDTWFDFNDFNTSAINGTVKLSYNASTDELLVLNDNGLFVAASASSAGTPVYAAALAGLVAGTDIRGLSNNGTDWFVATSDGIYTTPAAAINWTAANNGFNSLDATAVVAVNDTVVSAVRKTGIYKSAATAVNWSLNNMGFNNPVTHSMTSYGDSVIVTATEDGVWVSTAMGVAATFVKKNNGLTDSTNVTDVLAIDKFNFIASTANGGVFRTTNQGTSWTAVNNGLSNLNVKKLFYANSKVYLIDSNNDLFAADNGAFAWTVIENGLPVSAVPTSLAFYGNDLFLGTLGDGVFKKSHFADAWASFNSGLSATNVTSVTAASGKVFAGTDGDGVFVSNTGADAWTQTASTSFAYATMIGLDVTRIQSMAAYAGYVYAGFKGGVVTTSDNGATWDEAGTQFNLPSFTNVHKLGFITTRVLALTEFNGPYGNSLTELPALPHFLTLSDNTLDVPETANTNYVSVTSNVPWTLSSNQPWLTATPTNGFRDGSVTITATANTGAPRTGVITFTSDSLSLPETLVVNQAGTIGIGDELSNGAIVTLYPNPSDGSFTVNFIAALVCNRVTIYDVVGKRVFELNPKASVVAVPVNAALVTGVYTIEISTDKGTFRQKLNIR